MKPLEAVSTPPLPATAVTAQDRGRRGGCLVFAAPFSGGLRWFIMGGSRPKNQVARVRFVFPILPSSPFISVPKISHPLFFLFLASSHSHGGSSKQSKGANMLGVQWSLLRSGGGDTERLRLVAISTVQVFQVTLRILIFIYLFEWSLWQCYNIQHYQEDQSCRSNNQEILVKIKRLISLAITLYIKLISQVPCFPCTTFSGLWSLNIGVVQQLFKTYKNSIGVVVRTKYLGAHWYCGKDKNDDAF